MKYPLLLLGLLALSGPSLAAGLDAFDRTADAAIPGYNVERLNNVSPEQCAQACLDDGRPWCLSFDYHKNTQACDLSDKRGADVGGLKTDYPGNPYDHYNLRPSPLSQFLHTPSASLPGQNAEQLKGVSVEECAAACTDDQRNYWCKSFDYNKRSGNCTLSGALAAEVGGLTLDSSGQVFDHYELYSDKGIPNPIKGNKHVLVIGIDGLRGDAIQCHGCADTPALDSLIAGGAFHDNLVAGGVQSTFSGPGWSTVFTGFWADQHGVTSNDASLPLQKPHVFDLIEQAYPSATTAVVADWRNLTSNLRSKGADFVLSNRNKDSQQATDQVKEWLGWDNAPTAIFYYLHNVDIHTQAYAPLHPTYKAKLSGEDQQIQQVLDALVARPDYADEQWLILVTSDHGGLNTGHGGQSASERNTFLILNNSYLSPGKTPYCTGDLSGTPMTQADGVTPHILDFLSLNNDTAGRKHPACGQ